MDRFFRACIEANRMIYREIGVGLDRRQQQMKTRGAGCDISSVIDLEAEAIFVRHLEPFGRIDSEESGSIGKGEKAIVLDPIDGSSNILSQFPYYGTSVALTHPDGTIEAACVANLANGTIHFKHPGTPALSGSLFGETFTPSVPPVASQIGIFERAYAHPDVGRALGKLGWKFRAPGAVALSLVYAKNARFFLYMGRYRRYDFAAGLALCEGLEVETNEDYVIVSHDEATQNVLRTIAQTTKEK
jgi:myo-inositol-1(or 4)-monophosphatase